jgi:hypothetical protein
MSKGPAQPLYRFSERAQGQILSVLFMTSLIEAATQVAQFREQRIDMVPIIIALQFLTQFRKLLARYFDTTTQLSQRSRFGPVSVVSACHGVSSGVR